MWGRRDRNVLRCQAQGHDDNTAPDGCPRLLENRPTGVRPAATRAVNVQQSRRRWPETTQADHGCREETLRQSPLLLSALFAGFQLLFLRNTNNKEIVFAFFFVFSASSFISDSFLNLDGAVITKVPLTVPWCPLFPPKSGQVTGSGLSFRGPGPRPPPPSRNLRQMCLPPATRWRQTSSCVFPTANEGFVFILRSPITHRCIVSFLLLATWCFSLHVPGFIRQAAPQGVEGAKWLSPMSLSLDVANSR